MSITISEYFALIEAVKDRIDAMLISETGAAIVLTYRLVRARELHKGGYFQAAWAALQGFER